MKGRHAENLDQSSFRRARWPMAGTLAAAAWLMLAIGWTYPPIPMFIAAVVGGFLCMGHPRAAVRASLWAGLIAGPAAELAYWQQRLDSGLALWQQMTSWERLGLGAAEMLLYAGALAFFAAFISWATDNPAAKDPHGLSRSRGLPSPDPEDLPNVPEIPLLRDEPPPRKS